MQSSKTSTFLSSKLLKSSFQVSVCESTTCAVAATLSIRVLEGLQGAMPAWTRECRDNCIMFRCGSSTRDAVRARASKLTMTNKMMVMGQGADRINLNQSETNRRCQISSSTTPLIAWPTFKAVAAVQVALRPELQGGAERKYPSPVNSRAASV